MNGSTDDQPTIIRLFAGDGSAVMQRRSSGEKQASNRRDVKNFKKERVKFMSENEKMNALIRNAARPKTLTAAKPTSQLDRSAFPDDEAYLKARALEKLQLESPEFRKAYSEAQRELRAAQAAEAENERAAKRAELLKTTRVDSDEESALGEAALQEAEKLFASGKIQHSQIPEMASKIGDGMRAKAIEKKVDGLLFNQHVREEIYKNSGRLKPDGSVEILDAHAETVIEEDGE